MDVSLDQPTHPAPQSSAARSYSEFLEDYYTAADELRISEGVHEAIGSKINRVIQAHPGCTHLITCGNNHLSNCRVPLDRFVILPGGGNCVVDIDDGQRWVGRVAAPTLA